MSDDERGDVETEMSWRSSGKEGRLGVGLGTVVEVVGDGMMMTDRAAGFAGPGVVIEPRVVGEAVGDGESVVGGVAVVAVGKRVIGDGEREPVGS